MAIYRVRIVLLLECHRVSLLPDSLCLRRTALRRFLRRSRGLCEQSSGEPVEHNIQDTVNCVRVHWRHAWCATSRRSRTGCLSVLLLLGRSACDSFCTRSPTLFADFPTARASWSVGFRCVVIQHPGRIVCRSRATHLERHNRLPRCRRCTPGCRAAGPTPTARQNPSCEAGLHRHVPSS